MPNIRKGMMGAAGAGGVGAYQIYGLGQGQFAQLAEGTGRSNATSPILVGPKKDWTAATASMYNVMGISNGKLYAWGKNVLGLNGTGTADAFLEAPPFTQVGALTDWSLLPNLGANKTMHAIKTDGTLWGWGMNTPSSGGGGLIGDGTTTDRSSPVQIGSLTTWASVKVGIFMGAALKTDGTLWTWGSGASGQTGQSTTSDTSSPVQIASGVASFSCSGDGGGFITTSNKLYTWGQNNTGQLGINLAAGGSRSSPVPVGSLTDWSNVTINSSRTAAVKTDGTLWAWAGGFYGPWNNSGVSYSSPIQIGSLTDWAVILDRPAQAGGTARNTSFCIKTDGTLWAWGGYKNAYNFNQTGVYTAVVRSPVQVGTQTHYGPSVNSIFSSSNFFGRRTLT